MDSKTIRQQFIDYFKTKRDHTVVPGAPVVPQNDPTLLFTNAGMNQFKPYFLGELIPPYKRAVNTQKCIRVSGKHNDLEEVGRDHNHHTFFEMLGSWSFGDYYKKEAIEWAWELFTVVWGIDPQRLYATVYTDDEEAYEIWKNIPDIKPDHILRFGEKDNFWSMGEIGPCGPCSEIHYYNGDDPDKQDPGKVNSGDEEYMELWNLVFIQYNATGDGKLQTLEKKHVDTGAGFERIAAVLQNKHSNYETDLFKPIIEQIELLSKIAYEEGADGIPHRVIADHIRMLTAAIADGAIPGNEGRAYVLRRILRRAARFGRKLRMKEPFLYRLVPAVIHILGDVYPELATQREHIQRIIRAEEESFGNTLDKGLELFERFAKKAKKSPEKQLSSEDVFRLYDTYGFPVDLTRLLAGEKDLSMDEEEIEKLMEEQRERARAAGKFKHRSVKKLDWTVLQENIKPEFTGYDNFSTQSRLIKFATDKEHSYLVFNKTPFYAESGGQVGDKGEIRVKTPGGTRSLEILDTQLMGEDIVHITKGDIVKVILQNNEVELRVNEGTRLDTARNHSATHLLHAVLENILGEHVHQSGSYVGPDRLRFDFTHFKKLGDEEITEIQKRVNTKILHNISVQTRKEHYTEAIRGGAKALFGEKYGDEVRVVSMGNESCELCGGTHVDRTGDIGIFIIVNESSVAAGVRRIEALTGVPAMRRIESQQSLLSSLRRQLKVEDNKIMKRIRVMQKDIKELEKENLELKSRLLSLDIDKYFQNVSHYKNVSLYVNRINVESMDQLKELGDKVRGKMKSGIAVFGTVIKDTPQLLCVVSDDLVKQGFNAGDLVRVLGKALGGGGGGKPHMATAGGKDAEKLNGILEKAAMILEDT
ncbi:MAG: alanine--tRNA ligase [Candidatus Marinimicrobia bacterium]|nr:alanine--tRNA ligase [Candidatus Neomarinimicrobiota bacterium]